MDNHFHSVRDNFFAHDDKSVQEADTDVWNGPAGGGDKLVPLAPLCVLWDVFDDSDGERKLVIAIHIPSGPTGNVFVFSVGDSVQTLEI